MKKWWNSDGTVMKQWRNSENKANRWSCSEAVMHQTYSATSDLAHCYGSKPNVSKSENEKTKWRTTVTSRIWSEKPGSQHPDSPGGKTEAFTFFPHKDDFVYHTAFIHAAFSLVSSLPVSPPSELLHKPPPPPSAPHSVPGKSCDDHQHSDSGRFSSSGAEPDAELVSLSFSVQQPKDFYCWICLLFTINVLSLLNCCVVKQQRL